MGQSSPKPSCDFAFELVVAQPKRLSRPEEGSAAEQPHANPVVGICWVEGVGNLLLVDPDVGIELVGLEDMLQPARWFETTVGKLVGRLALGICWRRRLRDPRSASGSGRLFGQDLGGHAACVARPDNQYIEDFRFSLNVNGPTSSTADR